MAKGIFSDVWGRPVFKWDTEEEQDTEEQVYIHENGIEEVE